LPSDQNLYLIIRQTHSKPLSRRIQLLAADLWSIHSLILLIVTRPSFLGRNTLQQSAQLHLISAVESSPVYNIHIATCNNL
jgi:hypothetical protein